jgi:DNA-binding NtrC family response regulator
MHKVLYVDDQVVWARAVGTFLRLAGYPVTVAAGREEAMAHAMGGRIGTMIMDVDLGAEDPLEILKSVKAKNPAAQVVLYTGLEKEHACVQKLLRGGASRYLHKGNLKELLRCLQELSQKPGQLERGPQLAMAGS